METTKTMSFYKTDKFKKLKAMWDNKLQKSGFKDAEVTNNGKTLLKDWHSSYFKIRHTPEAFQTKQEYYRAASSFLHRHEFETTLDKHVWLLHSEGISLRAIGIELKINKDKANGIVKKLCAAMKKSLHVK